MLQYWQSTWTSVPFLLNVYKIIGGALLKGVYSLHICSLPTQLGYLECEMSLELRVD